MAVNDIAVQEFVNAIKEPPQDTNNTYNATVSRIDDEGVVWVYLQGSEIETPTASTSSEVEDGDSVTVQWRNNKLYIGGNYSNPSAGTTTVMPSVNFVSELLDKDISADSVSAATGYIGELTARNITAEDITADHATIDSLDANYAHITDGVIDNAKIGYADVEDLDANYAHITNGVIDNAEIDYADVNNLSTNYAQINLANVNNAWIENGVVKDAAISDAQILGVSANKLTAGTIDASNITVTNLNASNITTGSITVDGITIDVENNEASIDGSYIEDGTITMNGFAQEVKDVIDGAIETFTGTVVPTLNNAPANAWTTTKLKDQHIGDVYYVVNASSKQNGYCYRFSKSGSTYSWQLIKDSDVTAALQRLQTAEGKISNIESFDEEMATFKTETEGEISTLQTKTTSLETSLGDKVDKTVFNEVKQTVDGNSASITELSTITTNNGLTKTTNITNTVNTVSQTAAGNSSKISSLTNTLGTNADGTTKAGDIVHQVSQIDQDLDGVTTRVSKTEVKLAGQYATSSTGAGTTAKVATITPAVTGWTLYTGATVTVKFSTANTATTPTLNVNSTGAKTIKGYKGAALTEKEYKWAANDAITFIYDGTNWLMQSSSTEATRLSTAEASISTNAGNIALKANASDVYTKTAANALLEVKANKDTLTSEINASADTVKINANRVQIDGTATFNAIKSKTDAAYDAKGSASAAESNAKDYADGAVADKADKSNAVARTQRIYYRKTSSGAPSANKTWLATSGTGYGNWSLKVPQMTSGTTKYPYLYTAVQSQTVSQMSGTTCSCSSVLLDDTTTVIDGGNIITGTITSDLISTDKIDANKIKVEDIQIKAAQIKSGTIDTARIPNLSAGKITSGTLDASKVTVSNLSAESIKSGDIAADRMKANSIEAINSLTTGKIDAARINVGQITVGSLSDGSSYSTTTQMKTAINNVRSWYATCSTAAGTAAKVATITPTTTAFTTSVLTAGTLVNVKFTVTNTAAVGDLTLNINNTGAKHIKTLRYGVINNIAGAGYLAKDTTYQFTYDGTYWVMQENYNSDTQNRTRWQNVIAAAEAITNGHIICGTASGYRDIAANVSFDMAYPLLYAATAIAKGATTGTRDNNFLEINGINASVNGTITSGAANKILFLKGTLTGNTFKISASPFLTTVVPTSQDNLCYIPLGIMYSATNIYFKSSDQIYAYKDGAFGPISMREASAAAKTATTYITHIDNNGIRVHPSSTQNNSVVINAKGMEVFNGGTTSEYSVAKYGDTARIGKEGGSHLTLAPDSMSMSDGVKDVFNLLQKTMYIRWNRNYKGRQFANSTDRHVDSWETNTTISTWDSITVNYKLNNTSKTKKITSISNGVLANDEIYVHFNYSGTIITLTYGRGSSAASSDIIKLESAVVYYVTDEKLSQLHTGAYPNTTVSGALRIGNGTSDSNRKNLLLVDWSGTGKFKGDILAFCGADSSGGMSLTKAEENIDAFKYEDANGHVYIDAYRVGRIVSLLCGVTKTASTAAGANLYQLDLTNAHLPKPLGTNTSGIGMAGKNMIFGNIYYNKTVTPNRYEFVCRNGGSTAVSIPGVGFTITYICQMDEVSGEIKYMDD